MDGGWSSKNQGTWPFPRGSDALCCVQPSIRAAVKTDVRKKCQAPDILCAVSAPRISDFGGRGAMRHDIYDRKLSPRIARLQYEKIASGPN